MLENEYPDMVYLSRLADAAGKTMRDFFSQKISREWKPGEGADLGSNETPVTVVDRAINDRVLAHLTRDYPGVSAIGEEGSRKVRDAKYTVVWDPIDGTHAFMNGMAVATFCITVLDNHIPIETLIHDPLSYNPRKWWAKRYGFDARVCLNDTDIRVSERAILSRAQIGMVWWGGCRYRMHEVAGHLMERGVTVANPLSLVYCGALVASGYLDAVIFPGHHIWEATAIQCLVETAGGRVTDVFGESLCYDTGEIRGCVASNGLIHEDILKIIRGCQ